MPRPALIPALVITLLLGCTATGYRPHIVDGWGYDLRSIGADRGIPPIEALPGDVLRVWAFELFSGELTHLYDIDLGAGTVLVRSVDYDGNHRFYHMRTEALDNDLDLILATGIQSVEGFHDNPQTDDGVEYHIESRIGGRYRYAIYNNPDTIADAQAQLMVRAMAILEDYER